MKILCITSPALTGLNYHRQLVPFNNLGIEVEYQELWQDFTDEYLQGFSVVSFLRTISTNGRTLEVCNRIHKLGLKIHFDIDDYWVLPVAHPMYPQFKKHNISIQVIEALKNVDLVTCTTEYLAEKIKYHNQNVHVLLNAIQPNEEQWQRVQTYNDRVRFGYIAGVHHAMDIEMIHGNILKIHKDFELNKTIQMVVAGFNLNGSEMNLYYKYIEMLFTDNYKAIKDKEYLTYLLANNPEQNEQTFDRFYRRLWGLDTFNYGKLYNLIDVSLVPLKETIFSACKSELKLIEAGFMKKAVIVSNVKPYEGIATKDNAIIINPNRNHIEWYTSIKHLSKDRERIADLADAMYDTVKVKYHIDTVNVERKQLFEAL